MWNPSLEHKHVPQLWQSLIAVCSEPQLNSITSHHRHHTRHWTNPTITSTHPDHSNRAEMLVLAIHVQAMKVKKTITAAAHASCLHFMLMGTSGHSSAGVTR